MVPQPNLPFPEAAPPPICPSRLPSIPLFTSHSPYILFFSTRCVGHFSNICCSLWIYPSIHFSHVLICAPPVLFLNPSDPAQMFKNVLPSPLSNCNTNFFSSLLLYFSSVILLFIPSCHFHLSLSATLVFTSVFQVPRPISTLAPSSPIS